MKILVLQGSQRMENGMTEIVMRTFLKGVEKSNNSVETEVVYLADRIIMPCKGCLKCWTGTEGRCVLNDDMTDIVRSFIEADIVIASTPMYFDGMSSCMKRTWERFLPLLSPYFKKGRIKSMHEVRDDKERGLFLISVCALPELIQFDPLVLSFERMAYNLRMKYMGQLLRPESHSLENKNKFSDKIEKVMKGIVTCGEEFGMMRTIPDEKLDRAQMPLAKSTDEFIEMNNLMWDRVLKVNRD